MRIIFLALILIFSVNLFAAAEKNAEHDLRKTALPGTVALTFDDGPNPTFTPQILAILKKYDIKATFFVVGMNAEKYPDLIKAIHDDGHVIASHSQTHAM